MTFTFEYDILNISIFLFDCLDNLFSLMRRNDSILRTLFNLRGLVNLAY